jgi:arylformamidase
MLISFTHNKQIYSADLSQPMDISLGFSMEYGSGANCFYAPPFEAVAVRDGDWEGLVTSGSPVNFLNVRLNPHGNGTHTECVGHISPTIFSINEALRQAHFIAKLVSVYPTLQDDADRVITLAQMMDLVEPNETKALIIRTLPNDMSKRSRQYSNTNPPYIAAEALSYLADCGVEHLLLDLPSVDRESDGGKVAAHKAFWQYPDDIRHNATITELIFVENTIKDGFYLLNLQIAPFPIDATPSKPVLYELFL